MKKIVILAYFMISLSLLSYDPMKLNRGYLFAVEGTEGCGKTTLIKNLTKKLSQLNIPVVTTREPGGTQLGKEMRSMLMNQSVPMCTLTEFLIFAADRAQHFHELIIPHLAQQQVVISDRMADSSLVYQGYVKGLDQSMISIVNRWAMQYQQPDLILYLKLDCITALERINKRNQTETQVAFEAEILAKKEMLTAGFDTILQHRDNVIVLDATLTPEEITNQAFEQILAYIQNNS